MPVSERFSAKQYGARYGSNLKEKIGKINRERALSNACPYCHYKRVKRIAAGIWLCGKCQSKFTGRAYAIGKKLEEVSELEKAAEAPVGKALEEPVKEPEEEPSEF